MAEEHNGSLGPCERLELGFIPGIPLHRQCQAQQEEVTVQTTSAQCFDDLKLCA